MTDNDRAMLDALKNACDTFCLSLAGSRLTQDDHVEMALMFIDMADRILKRMIDSPTTTEDNTT